MTTQSRIKGLMFAAAVAMTSAACGTSGSPTGMDVSAIEATAGFSALRSEPTPPQAPEPQGPGSEPLPGDPGPVPEADTKPLDPKDDPTSVPSNRPNRPLPGTVPNDSPGPDTVPENEGPDTVPNVGSDTVPTTVPPTSDPSEGTTPPESSDPGSVPAPTPGTVPAPPSEPTTAKCAAVSMQIVALTNIAAPAGGFMAVLTDMAGNTIEDMSCEKLVWRVEGDLPGSGFTITYGDVSRFVTVDGPDGAYKLSAIAPNGVSASTVFGGK